MMKILFTIVLMALTKILLGQNGEKIITEDFKKMNSQSKCIVIGENHIKENANRQIDLIKELYIDWNVSTIGLELPLYSQKLCNDYVVEGNLEAFELLKKKLNIKVNDNLFNLLNGIRCLNSNEFKNHKIRISCFDIQFKPVSLAFNGFWNLLIYYNNPKLNPLIDITFSSTKSIDELKNAIDNFRAELNSKQDLYKSIFKEDYNHILKIIKSIEVSNFNGESTPENESFYFEREKFIFANICDELEKADNKIVVFAGNMHCSKIKNDTLFYPNSIEHFFTSTFTCMLNEKYGKDLIKSYPTLYLFEKQKSLKHYEFFEDLLPLELISLVKNNDAPFQFYNNEQIKAEFFNSRFDGFFIDINRRTKTRQNG